MATQQKEQQSDVYHLGAISRDIVNIYSYNMHGFNQGCQTVRDITVSSNVCADILFLQEHWLTPANLSKFEENFPMFMPFGSSAMRACVESGVLHGRPFGGVMTLVHKKWLRCTELVCATDRYVVVIVGNLLLINVYMPCAGSPNRVLIYNDIFDNLSALVHDYPEHNIVVGGDINTDLNISNPVSDVCNRFCDEMKLDRCDELTNTGNRLSTYFNDTLNCGSTIDYFFISNKSIVLDFDVIDHDSNLSDHRPIVLCCKGLVPNELSVKMDECRGQPQSRSKVGRLRWDHADLALYQNTTRELLDPVLDELCRLEYSNDIKPDNIENIYQSITDALIHRPLRYHVTKTNSLNSGGMTNLRKLNKDR